jgi:hypothetical protein
MNKENNTIAFVDDACHSRRLHLIYFMLLYGTSCNLPDVVASQHCLADFHVVFHLFLFDPSIELFEGGSSFFVANLLGQRYPSFEIFVVIDQFNVFEEAFQPHFSDLAVFIEPDDVGLSYSQHCVLDVRLFAALCPPGDVAKDQLLVEVS